MSESKQLVIVACPPHPEYQEGPKDQSASILFKCPHCPNSMWLSEKKRGILLFASCTNQDIYLGCYDCITKYFNDNPEIIGKAETMNL